MARENTQKEKGPEDIAKEIFQMIKKEFKSSNLNLEVLDKDEEEGENFEISSEDKGISFAFSIKDKMFYIIDFQIKKKEDGLGKKIIKKIEKILKSVGFKKIIIDPVVDSTQARSFWLGRENCGFTKTGPNTAEKILK